MSIQEDLGLDWEHVTPITEREYQTDSERDALVEVLTDGISILKPLKPLKLHELLTEITPDNQLFHMIHMGVAAVDPSRWRLLIDGLVHHPLILDFRQLRRM
ncbi:hypothetical protein BDW71DRAFT_211360 [Aspergillus fruticulosus]